MKQQDKISFGSVQVHKKVLAEIVHSAICKIEGVRLIQKTLWQRFFDFGGRKRFYGISIRENEGQNVSLEVKIIVCYGINIPDIARQVQQEVTQAVGKVIDINLTDININILGMYTEKQGRER